LYATSLNALALLYQTLGNYSDAGSLLTEARTLFEKRYGVWNAEYSTATQNLAALYQLEGEFQKAEPLLRQAIDIDRKVSGENNPQFAILLQNLATLYQKLGQRDDAEKTLNQALELTRRTLGNNHKPNQPKCTKTPKNTTNFFRTTLPLAAPMPNTPWPPINAASRAQ
jgi:tetratricopeptide (TPR) repeat protein